MKKMNKCKSEYINMNCPKHHILCYHIENTEENYKIIQDVRKEYHEYMGYEITDNGLLMYSFDNNPEEENKEIFCICDTKIKEISKTIIMDDCINSSELDVRDIQ